MVGRDDGQCNPNPLAIEEEKQLVVDNRASHTASKVVHRRARLVISRSGIREIVGRVELRAVPQLVEIPVKLVRAGLCNVVDLGRSIPSLIDGIGKRIDRHLRYRIQSEDEVCRESAVQIRQRVIRFQAIDDVAVRESGQSIELHVAVPIRAADEIIAAACRVDERAGGKLKRVGQIAAWIRKVFQRGALRVVDVFAFSGLRIGASPLTSTVCFDWAILRVKSTVCFWPRPEDTAIILLRFEAFRFHLDRVRARLQLRKVEPA